jgi:hypothetical protein
MNPEFRDKLGKVLAMLTSPYEGEQLAAATRFSALLAAHSVHPSQVLENGNGSALTETQKRQIHDEGFKRGFAAGVQTARNPEQPAGPASRTVSHLMMVIRAALDNPEALTEWEQGFVDSINGRFVAYGTRVFVSEKQWNIIDRIERKLRAYGVL